MKRMMAVLCTIILVVMTIFSGITPAEPADLAGTWYLQYGREDDMEIDAAFFYQFGMNMTVTLNEDGTATVDNMGDIQEGTWSFDGNTGTIQMANPVIFTYDGTQILIETDEYQMALGREEPVIELFTPAPAVSNAQLSDYNGVWNCKNGVSSGIRIPMKMLPGLLIKMTINGENVLFHEDMLDLTNDFAIQETAENTLKGELLGDGSYRVNFSGNELVQGQLASYGGAQYMLLTLREDGIIVALFPEYLEALKESYEQMDIHVLDGLTDEQAVSYLFEREGGAIASEPVAQELASTESNSDYEAASENLLVNPNWENGLDGWEIQAENESGTYQGQMKLHSLVFQDIPIGDINVMQKLRLSGDIAVEPNDPTQVCIRMGMGIFDQNGSIIDSKVETEEGSEKAHHEIVMDIPGEATKIRVFLEIWKDSTDNSFNYENLVLESVEETSSGEGSFTRTGSQTQPEASSEGAFARSGGQEEPAAEPESDSEPQSILETETLTLPELPSEPESTPEVTTGNLLLNPDLKDAYAGWSVFADNQDVDTSVGPGKASALFQDIPLKLYSPGQTMRLSATLSCAQEDPNQLFIQVNLWVYDAQDNRIASDNLLKYGTDPEDMELTLEIPEGAEYARVCVGIAKTGDQNIYNASDVSLEILGKGLNEEVARILIDNAGVYTPYALEANGSLIEVDSIDTEADVSDRIRLNADGTGDWNGIAIMWNADGGTFTIDGDVYGTIGDGVMMWNNLESPDSADGRMYFLREGTDPSVLEAVTQNQYLQSEARPYYELGISYMYGTAEDGYDSDKAYENFKIAYDNGIADAGYYMGELILKSADDNRFERAGAIFEEAIQNGSLLALIGLGDLYLNGYGLELDQAKALELYQTSLDQGCIEANNALGFLYEKGYGVEADGTTALDYYTKALDSTEYGFQNDAKCSIGRLYLNGAPGISQDYGQAMLWFARAAQEAFGEAYYYTGYLYEHGLGVEENIGEALTWFQRAVRCGSGNGLEGLGLIHFNEAYAAEDPGTSLQIWTQGADMGHAGCMYLIGVYYEFGGGSESQLDHAAARGWYQKALTAAGVDEYLRNNITEALARLDEYEQSQNNGYDTSADYGYDYGQYETQPWEDPYFIGYSQDGIPMYSYN